MTRRIGDTIIIAAEGDDLCAECGAFDELRPYGKHGARICFACGEKNPEATRAMMNHVLFGDPLPGTEN